MKVNKIINVFLLFLIFMCLTTVVVAELPNNASTDGNHFYQEIIVESEINKQNASVQINLPFQYNYSNIISTYRVYDSVGNPIRFHVMETSLSESSILLKMDLLDGKNTIYVTGGNYSLQNISDETVYDTVFKNRILNASTTEQIGYYNLMEARFSNITSNNYPQLYFTNESNVNLSSLYAVNNSSTSSVRYIYDSGSSGSQNYVEFSSIRSYTTERFTISIQGSNGGTEIHTYGYRNATYFTKTELNNSYNFYGTGFRYNPGTSSIMNITHMGFSNVTPTQNEIGEIVVIKNEGLYIKIVDGVTGKPLSGTEHNGNKLIANATTAGAIYMNHTMTYMSYNATFTQNGVTNNYKIGQGRESVIYIPDFSYDSPFSITFPAGTNISITQFSGIVIPEISPKSSIDMPIYRIITDQNNTSSGAVYGLLTDRYGQPVPNATVTYIRNGSIVETVLVQDGGEWGRKSLVGETYIRFEAPGFKTTEGYVTGPSMNYIVMEGIYNITIGAIDSATQENILAFTTYLGENQTIQSTDNGTVKYFNVSEGEIDIIIQADGYNQISRKIYIGDNKTNFTLYMSKSNNSSGGIIESPQYVRYVVVNQFGQKVSNALIQIYEDNTENNLLMYKYTGSDGSATFSVNRTLPYYIIVSKPSNGIEYNYTMSGVYSDLYYIYVIANDNTQQNKPIDRVILASAKLKINHGELSNAYAYILVDVHSTNNEQLFADITTDTTLPNYILVDNTTTLQYAYYMTESEYNDFKSNLTKLNFEINATVNKATGNYENVVSYQFTNAGINLLQLNVDKDVMDAISTVIIYIIALSLAAYTTGFYTGIATIISAIGLNYIGWIVLPQTFWLFAALFVIVGIYNIMKDRM